MHIYNHNQVNQPIINIEKSKKREKKRTISLSPSETLNLMKEIESQFVQPRPQPELNGEVGVTLSDIARSLGVTHKDLKRKVDRSGAKGRINRMKHRIRTYILIPAAGARTDSYVMDITAAQHIVSKYDNDAGWAYTDYLIRCKDALTVSLAELEKNTIEINLLRKKLAESEQKQSEVQKKIRTPARHEVVLGEEFDTYCSDGLKKVAKVTRKRRR